MHCDGAGIVLKTRDDFFPVHVNAFARDAAAVRVARSRGALDLALGETLLRLFEGDRLLQLGYARQVDYARERLGVSARAMFLWLRLARGLSERPLLRRAVVVGAVTPRKALAIFPVAVGEDEGPWTAAAIASPLAALEQKVRAAGEEPASFAYEVESLWLKMTPAQQDRLDAALALAQETLGPGAPRWQCLEAICQEWLGTFGAWVPEEGAAPSAAPPEPAGQEERQQEEMQKRGRTLDLQLQAIAEAVGVVEGVVEGPAAEAGGDDPRALDARALRLLAARRRFDAAFGPLVVRIVEGRSWEVLGYRSLEEYCRERLGLSARSVQHRVWLERRLEALPELRAALAAGRLTYSKALLVAKDATPGTVAERIGEAAATTWQQLERESTAREDATNRAAGVRRLWGPQDAARTVVDAIGSAQAWSKMARGEAIDAGEALAVVADHFVAVWREHLPRRRMPKERRQVLMRHGGLCAVPGCSRPAEHVHHVTFHHLRGIHRGYLTVAGRAGERLVWRLGTSEAVPLEEWVTEGDDDVRRANGEARSALVPAGAR
jgi:hypothetical protein